MQPDGICIPSDELVHIHTVDSWRSLNSLLFPVDEDGHVLLLPPLLFRLFSGSEFSFTLCHDGYCSVSLPRRICRDRMHSAFGNPPVLDPHSPFLTLEIPPFVHVGSICSIHIATDGTFGLVRILPMIGPRHSAMTAALLAVRIQVADFYGLAAAFLSLNLVIGVVHIDLLSQRLESPGLKAVRLLGSGEFHC